MRGMHANTGHALDGLAHLKQSIQDILTTPIGTRIMRREYGSRLSEWVDAPLNGSVLIDITMATAEALARWEPRFKLTRVRVGQVEPGHVTLDLDGEYRPDGKRIQLEGIVI